MYNQLKTCWEWLNKYAAAIGLFISTIGLMAIFYGLKSFQIELNKFKLDYGEKVEMKFSYDSVYAVPKNEMVTNIHIRSAKVFIKLSENYFDTVNPKYIEISDIFSPCGYPNCDDLSFREIRPKGITLSKQIDNLEYVFNMTPTKLYASLICIFTIEYYSKNIIEKENYLSNGCNINEYRENEQPGRISNEQLETLIEDKILGKIDYSQTNNFGIASDYGINRLLQILARNYWKVHIRETRGFKVYRIGSLLWGNDTEKTILAEDPTEFFRSKEPPLKMIDIVYPYLF